jgi:hypothetical protein
MTENVECKLPVGSRSIVIGSIVESKKHDDSNKARGETNTVLTVNQNPTVADCYLGSLLLPCAPLLEITLVDFLRSRESADDFLFAHMSQTSG